ncbi:MAG: metallophosphoesterase [Bacillota bacterium]|nr:metallophosphoesterase [Bacillota bacterium]
MAVFAISDLHLALSVDKPMDIFGNRWAGYMQRIKDMWDMKISEDDYVIIPGDISWATYLEQAFEDFTFIEGLKGKKIISKGNHDYWWTTISKLNKFLKDNNFLSISFMQNNSFKVEDCILCGTRGWKLPGDEDFDSEDKKIYLRELQRLELSLKSSPKEPGNRLIAAMHYPPFNSKGEPSQFVELMQSYNVDICIYGHLHGEGFKNAVTGIINNIDFRLVSADYLFFEPVRLA